MEYIFMNEINKKQEDNINQYDKLVDDISNNLGTRLSDLMSKLLNSAQEDLFTMSNEADNNEEQTRYFELMNLLRTLKPEIADEFNKNIKHYLIPADDFDKKQQAKKSDDDDELSLVEQDEMEGMVLVKGVAGRAAAKYREQLSHLEARLEHLALKSDTVFKQNALSPGNFCQAFDDALDSHFDNTNKKILFNMFDSEVANKLDALYDSINNRLIDAGILPQIKLHTKKQKSSGPRPNQQGGTDYPQDTAQSNEAADGYTAPPGGGIGGGTGGGMAGGNNISGFAMTAAPGSTYRQANQQPQQPLAGSHETPDNTTGYQHYTAGMPASQVGRVLGNYISGGAITPETAEKSSAAHAEFFPASTAQHFGHQEIIQALSSIQSLPQFEQPGDTRFDGEAIKQAVLAEIAKSSGGAVTKRINQIAEKTIDFIELIFDAIIDDEDISDAIKTLLLRLQIPVIKASMFDQEFFIYDDHPARTLLDTIADAGVGITEHTDELYIQLDKIIIGILGEYELGTETFQKALDDLKNYIEEQENLTRAREEEEQQQLLRKHARGTVLKALRATTTGKSLPEAVHPLILKRWPTLMFNHYLSKGKESHEWVTLVLTLRHIVDSVQPIGSADQLAKLATEKDSLLEQTEQYLNAASSSKKDVQTIMAAYRETVQEHIDDANFTQEEVSIAEEAISTAEPVEEELPVEEETGDDPVIPANLMPGMWFQVYMGEDRAARRCKLSVIIVEDANLMFVNHKGELVTEKSFDEFNKEISNNTSKMIMEHSAFDHAFKAVINRLN